MVPFNLEIQLEGNPVIITVEQLERFADVDGYTRYDITKTAAAQWFISISNRSTH